MAIVTDYTATQAIRMIVSAANRLSDGGVDSWLAVLEKLAPSAFARRQVAAVRRHWNGETPGSYALIRRVLREIDPEIQKRLAVNLVVKHHWEGGRKRTALRQEGIVIPFTILVSPTMRCNLSCQGCYAGEYGQRDDLSPTRMDSLLREGKDLGVHLFVILGGEPFVYSPLLDLMGAHEDAAFMVFTNGTLITPRVADRLLQIRNVVPLFSIEGLEQETDARRGPGTFRRVMAAMDALRERRVPFGFSSMVTRENAEEIIGDAFNDMLVEKGCLLGWHFLYMPVGRNPDPSLMPTPEQRELLRRQGAARIRATKPLFVADFWNDAPWVGGCIAGSRQYVHITSRGDVEPCIFCHFAVDNVNEKSLLQCLTSDFFRGIQKSEPHNPNLLRPCMMIDNPHVFRRLYEEYRPYPTHSGAEELVGSLVPVLDEYSRETGRILDPAWREEFEARGFQVPIGW